jgi:hypothetical protein
MPNFLEDYQPVEDRIREFWADHAQGRIVTRLLSSTDDVYVVQASVWRDETSDALMPAATGLAKESVSALPQNMKASALEVCETSAIGRALANLGYAPKGKRPSREEMKSAGEVAATLPAASPAPQSGSEAQGEGVTGPDTTVPGGTGDGGSAPASGDHTHEWTASPQKRRAKKGWRVCACGAAEKKESA